MYVVICIYTNICKNMRIVNLSTCMGQVENLVHSRATKLDLIDITRTNEFIMNMQIRNFSGISMIIKREIYKARRQNNM